MKPPVAADLPAQILATAVIPWTERFEFDEETFCRVVHLIARGLTKHIYVFGTAGEGYAVSDRQFDDITDAFWRTSRECGASAMVGLISLSLPTVIGRIERSHALGFRTFQLSLPSWGALNDSELDVFFAETCGRFPDCYFHHYNLQRAKRLLTSVEYRRLADAHPNLVGVKSSVEDPAQLADLLTMSPRLRFFFTEVGYALARRTHDVGLLISLASVNYDRAKAFVGGDDARRIADVRDFRAMTLTLNKLSGGRFHLDGAFDKMLLRVNMPEFPLRLLPPYASATEEEFERFRAALPPGWPPAEQQLSPPAHSHQPR